MKHFKITKGEFVVIMLKYKQNYLKTKKMLDTLTKETWDETAIGDMYWDYLTFIASFFEDIMEQEVFTNIIYEMIFCDSANIKTNSENEDEILTINDWADLYDFLETSLNSSC